MKAFFFVRVQTHKLLHFLFLKEKGKSTGITENFGQKGNIKL